MTLTERQELLEKITKLVQDKYYNPTFGGHDWPAIVSAHRDEILQAEDRPSFEAAVTKMLKELHNGSLGLLSTDTPVHSRNSISASFRCVRSDGKEHWAFQDVLPGGPADKSSIRPGDLLLSIAEKTARPPDPPAFPMGKSTVVEIQSGATGERRIVTFSTPDPQFKENPYTEPQSISASVIRPQQIGYLKISLFPGKLGIDFANRLSKTFQSTLKGIQRLIVDLRGNPGGGMGGLRLMSYLAPGRLPVGYSLSRVKARDGYDKNELPQFDRIPKSKLTVPLLIWKFKGHGSIAVFTENLGRHPWHKKIALLVNEHSSGASEMATQFVQDNRIAPIVGKRTAGRLAARTALDIGSGYRLALPALAWMSWTGANREGYGIEPDIPIDWSYDDAVQGRDNQLERAIEIVNSL